LYFASPLKAFSWELGIGVRGQKLESWGYRAEKKFDDIFSRLDTTHHRDGQTDGRTDTGRQQRPRLRIASCGKKKLGALTSFPKVNKYSINLLAIEVSEMTSGHYIDDERWL